jgi:hypothetical protein
MRKVVQGLKPRTIRSVTIAKSPPRWWSIRSAIDLTVNQLPAAGLRPTWERWMLAGAFGRRLIKRGQRGTITIISNDDAVGERVQPREFHTPDPKPLRSREARAVAVTLRAASRRAGARVLEAAARTPYGTAPSVTLSVEHPARFLKFKLSDLLKIYDRDRNRYEGYYLGIVDSSGRRVLELGSSTRMQSGSYWVRRDLDRCSPIAHLGVIRAREQSPPCRT